MPNTPANYQEALAAYARTLPPDLRISERRQALLAHLQRLRQKDQAQLEQKYEKALLTIQHSRLAAQQVHSEKQRQEELATTRQHLTAL